MSTRSRIGIKGPDEVESIYCHFDGYPTNNGRLLLEHWSDAAKLRALMELGDLSSLGEVIGQKHPFDAPFDKPEWCLAYGRDRGETGTEAEWHAVDNWPDSGQEWEYLFVPSEGWLYRKTWDAPSYQWEPLTAEFIEGEAAKEAAYLASQGIGA